MRSVRDALVVAWIQLSRSLRTRTALALCATYAVTSGGSAWAFTEVLHAIEGQVARTLRVPRTRHPGAMLDALRDDPDFRDMVSRLIGGPELLDWALDLPFLTVTAFWTALATLPFLAALIGAEAISADVRDRSLRFELLRSGRVELVMGRAIGLAALLLAALLTAMAATWGVAMAIMVGVSPLEQAGTLLVLTPRLAAWSLPFLGLGVAASQLSANPNVSRVLALGAVTASWVAAARLELALDEAPALWMDILEPLLPQTWMGALWGPGQGWLVSALVLLAMGCAATATTLPIFLRRNL